jgi:raffinose/stachyose/melibiose transport system permease protein
MTSARVAGRARWGPGRRRWPVIIAFLSPALIIYLLFVIYPITQGIRYSGYSWNGLRSLTDWVGLGNFRKIFADPVFIGAMKHNGIILLLSLVLQLPFALFLAVLLNQRLRGRAFLRMMFFAPYVVSEVVTAVVWRQLLRPGGFVDHTLAAVGAERLTQEWLANPKIVIYSVFFVVSWKYFGFHMVLMLAGLQQIPIELREAAAIDGASFRQTFWHVTLPLLGPTIRVSVFLSIIGSLQLFDLIWVLTGGGPVNASNTMATYMIDWGFRRMQIGYASAVSVIVFAISLVVALAYQRWVLRRDVEGALTVMGA